MTPVCRKVHFEGDPEVLRKCVKSRKGVQPFKTSRVQRCEPALSVLLGFCTVPAHSQNGMKCARWRLALYGRDSTLKTKGSQARSFRFCPQGWLREENYQNHLGRRTSPWNTTRCTFPGLFLAPWLLLCKPR